MWRAIVAIGIDKQGCNARITRGYVTKQEGRRKAGLLSIVKV